MATSKTGNKLRSIAAKKSVVRPKKNNNLEEESKAVIIKGDNSEMDIPLDENGLDPSEVSARYMLARASKLEQEDLQLKLKNARLRGELLDKDVVYQSVFLYLDKVMSNIERMAGAFLKDIAYKILTAEELTPDVQQEWIDQTLKQIDAAKKETVKRLNKIARNQK
jgi:hypothetical protein